MPLPSTLRWTRTQTTEFIPGWLRLVAVIETGIPADRIAGGRFLAEAMGAQLAGPGQSIKGALSLGEGKHIREFPELRVLAAPAAGQENIALAIDDILFVGDLDRTGWAPTEAAPDRVASTRRGLAAQLPDSRAHGSNGVMSTADLPSLQLPKPGPEPLNFEAVSLTNRGQADMFWADPRYGADARPLDADYVRERSTSPWAPVILDLRNEGADIDGARRIAPARLASEMGGLASGKELVVVADSETAAEEAARFLARLGMNAAYVAGPWES